MYILSKTNYQNFENNVESFKMLKEAQDAIVRKIIKSIKIN